MSTYNLENLHWLGHASFRIDTPGTVIYLDPWQLGEGNPPADLILITHEHRDHCSPEDVAKIQTDATTIVTVGACKDKLSGDLVVVKPGDQVTVKGVEIQVVPAYNLTKFRSPGVPFHPKGDDYAGYILTVEGQCIYHTGDTDLIPEMETFETDVALLPVSGTYVMTAEEALQAAEVIQPKVVVPMHIGRGIGSPQDAQAFKAAASIPIEILPNENP
jgi:L-ascorbate metabolism protein UlaG (beta-lactamase superfamily)